MIAGASDSPAWLSIVKPNNTLAAAKTCNDRRMVHLFGS
jgi:hypothetical protein